MVTGRIITVSYTHLDVYKRKIIGNPEGNKVEVPPLRVMHGKLSILGYRIGRLAWITDMLTMPGAEYDLLQGMDVLVMNALRPQPHHTHQNLKEALDLSLIHI